MGELLVVMFKGVRIAFAHLFLQASRNKYMSKALPSGKKRLLIDIEKQTLDLIEGECTIATYPISSSKFGVGMENGSFRTPTGRFQILEKIGVGTPEGMIFKGRKQTGKLADPGGDEDLILTRILWLDGLDPENRNTRDRHIYIHGTNQEGLIGTAASHGCIRLNNRDIIELFDLVTPGSLVEIRGPETQMS